MRSVCFLDPKRKLVEAVAEWLLPKARDDQGAKSLAHVMVVVPTAQSGRQLRLQLARSAAAVGWGGLIPPTVKLPMQLIATVDETYRTATSAELRGVFLKFVEQRPRRHLVGGHVELDEWWNLFQPDYIADRRSHLAFFEQLSDIWRVLAGGGLLMREIAKLPAAQAVLAEALGDEVARWRELGQFETAFFEYLHSFGIRHPSEVFASARRAAAQLSTEIDEVALPALVDPVSVMYDVLLQQRDDLQLSVLIHADVADAWRFDEWGRPKTDAWIGSARPVLTGLRNDDVVRAATDAELAKRLAADYPAPKSGLARPSLGLVDPAAFSVMSAELLNRGYELYNPERTRIAQSSLGRILLQALDCFAQRSRGLAWDSLVSLLREDDVMTAVLGRVEVPHGVAKPSRINVLQGADICHNAFLPNLVSGPLDFSAEKLMPWEQEAFTAFRQAADALIELIDECASAAVAPQGFLRRLLTAIYAHRTLNGGEGEREFRAAAEAVRQVLNELDGDVMAALGLDERTMVALLRSELGSAAYSLDPDSPDAVKTEGWLELAWSDADRVALVGFSEGSVPDAVIGHPFIPDSLRRALGLTSNEQRLARDTYLFGELLTSRASIPGSVRAYVALANDQGDVRRPSRLLFLVDDAELAERVKTLFGELPSGDIKPAREVSPDWRLRLPLEAPVPNTKASTPNGRLSASMLGDWLKCPFTYLLQDGMGLRPVERKEELDACDFGNFVHRALEQYAREQLDRTQRGLPQLVEICDIRQSLRAIVGGLRREYGDQPNVGISLQLDFAAARLDNFAAVQSAWAKTGWQIAEPPEYGFVAHPFAGEGDVDLPIKGSIDRIDYKEGVGYRLIDYKTWDHVSRITKSVLVGGEAQVAHAQALKLPLVTKDGDDLKNAHRFVSVQLSLYGKCLAQIEPRKFAGRIADYCYVLLGEDAANTVVFGSFEDQTPFEAQKQKWRKIVLAEYADVALDTARVAIRRIRGNFFWPPGPTDEWKFQLRSLLQNSPERDLPPGTPWRDAQEARLKGLAS